MSILCFLFFNQRKLTHVKYPIGKSHLSGKCALVGLVGHILYLVAQAKPGVMPFCPISYATC